VAYSNEQLLQGPQRENSLQSAQRWDKGRTDEISAFCRCLNISRDCEEVISPKVNCSIYMNKRKERCELQQ